jgi:hypothetical protein
MPSYDHSTQNSHPVPFGSLLKPPRRLLPAPVGFRAWLELLAAGSGEGGGDALAP